MEPLDYIKTWDELMIARDNLAERRTNLETELSEVKNQISHLDEILNHMAPLAGFTRITKISALGITDAIRAVLQQSKQRMSPNDVRHALADNDFDLSGYSAPMASIYKVLSRLHDSQEVKQTKEDGGKVFYSWKAHDPATGEPDEPPEGESLEKSEDAPSSGEITDEDIPF